VIRKYAFSPAIQRQAGDTFVRNGRWFEQWRAGNKIKQWDLATTPYIDVDPFESFGNTITKVFLEHHMPGQNVSLIGVVENPSTGVVRMKFSSGNEVELADWQDAAAIADGIDSNTEYAEKLLIGKSYRASPDGVNKTTQVGAAVSANLMADVPIVYTEPQ
jgi:hypothetical protein